MRLLSQCVNFNLQVQIKVCVGVGGLLKSVLPSLTTTEVPHRSSPLRPYLHHGNAVALKEILYFLENHPEILIISTLTHPQQPQDNLAAACSNIRKASV